MTPHDVDDVTLAFPAGISHLMPNVPAMYPDKEKWSSFQSDWFYGSITTTGLIAKPGIDKTKALRHLRAIQGSYEPRHEHKEAAVNYLASLWFEPTSTWSQPTSASKK